jgi:hypothetical protein
MIRNIVPQFVSIISWSSMVAWLWMGPILRLPIMHYDNSATTGIGLLVALAITSSIWMVGAEANAPKATK